MEMHLGKGRALCAAMAVTAFAALGFVSGASAHSGEFARFDFCPSTNPSVDKCLYSVTTGGEVVLGKKTVPIVNPVTLQGGLSEPNGEFVSNFFAATNGITLSKTPQPVPGGLAGIVPPEGSPPLVKAALKFFFENGLTGVNSTLELARPASEIKVSELNLIGESGPALVMPVKVHLENPFLGGNCYVGSSSSPIMLNLTTGATAPPPPNTSIHGTPGILEFTGEFEIAHLAGNILVDNAWSAPKASGCGGFLLELLVDPVIDATVGLPAAAGENTAILNNEVDLSTAFSVNNH
jgi:hypothetical protein